MSIQIVEFVLGGAPRHGGIVKLIDVFSMLMRESGTKYSEELDVSL